MESSQFGHSLTCKPYEDRNLSDLLSEAVQNIHAEITEFDVSEIGEVEDNSVPADPNVKNFSFTVVEDKIYYRQNSRMNPVDVSATAENRIKGMIKIRDCVRELIRLQTKVVLPLVLKKQNYIQQFAEHLIRCLKIKRIR